MLSSRSLDAEHIDDSTAVSSFSEQLKEAIEDDGSVEKQGCDKATKELSVLRAGVKLYEDQIAKDAAAAQAKDAAAANKDLRVQVEIRKIKRHSRRLRMALRRCKSTNKGKTESVKKKDATGGAAANPARCGTRAGNLQCDKIQPYNHRRRSSRNLYKSCPDSLERGFFIQVGHMSPMLLLAHRSSRHRCCL